MNLATPVTKSKRYPSVVLQTAVLALSPAFAMAIDGTWAGLANAHNSTASSFSNPSNWTGGVVASGVGAVATIDLVNTTNASPSVDIDQNMTLGSLILKNSGSTTLLPTIWGTGTSASRPVLTMATSDGSMPRLVVSQPGATTITTVQLTGGVGALANYFTIATSQGLYVDLGSNVQLNVLSSPWTTGTPATSFSGDFVIARGTYNTNAAGTSALPPSGSAHVVLGDSSQPAFQASLGISSAVSAGAIAGNANAFFFNGTSAVTGSSPNTSQSFVTMTLGANNDGGTFAGTVGRGHLDATTIYKTNLNFVKNGSGTQRFSGNLLNSGTTTINGGTWVVNGVHTPIINQGGDISKVSAANRYQPATTGTGGSYVINAGSSLAGNGTIKPFDTVGTAVRMIDVLSGGTIAPGDGGIGTLTLDGSASLTNLLTFEAGSTFDIDIGGSVSDRLAIVNSQTNDVTFNNTVVNVNAAASLTAASYVLFSSGAGSTYAGLTVDGSGTVTAGLQLSSAFLAQYPASSLRTSGGDIVLSVVPEPASLGAAGIAALALLRRPLLRRRCK